MNHTTLHHNRLIYTFLITLISVFSILLSACKEGAMNTPSENQLKLDAFSAEFPALIAEDIPSTKIKIAELQAEMTDSLYYYHLQLFLGKCFYYENKMDSAILNDQQIIRYCQRFEESKEHQALATFASNDLGVFHLILSKMDVAISYFEAAAKHAVSLPNQLKRIDIYINLADTYRQSNNYPLAADYFRKALMLADSLHVQDEFGVPIYMGLAHIYTDLQNFDLADKYFLSIEENLTQLPINEQIYFANTRGNYYYTKEDYADALPWFYKALKLSDEHGYSNNQNIAKINLGEVYLLLGQYDSAQYYLDEVKKAFQATETSPDILFYLDGLYASLYLKTNKKAEAEKLLSMPYDSTAISSLYQYLHGKRLEELYKQKGDFKKAYKYAKAAQFIDIEKRNTTVQNNIEEMKFRYSQDTTILKKDLFIKQQERKVQQMRNTLAFVFLGIIILVLSLIIVGIYRRKKHETYRATQTATISRLRLENVQNRMSPHFIFNVLNTLIPDLKAHPKLSQSVGYLIKAIRSNLTVSEQLTIQAETEVENVKNYIELLKCTQHELPAIQWDIANSVDLQILIPAMCIQIPVENALKYAFDEDREDNQLAIQIRQDANFLYIDICDNGKGFQVNHQQQNNKGTGSGLKILRKTMDLLNDKNTEKADFQIQENYIDNQAQGTKVSIQIPLAYNYEL